MKKISLLSLLYFISLLLQAQATKRVLFLGNSYTQVNNLPQLTASVAASLGDVLNYDYNTPGGYTLNQHYTTAASTDKIKAGGWDYVVLQEQSQLPSFEDYDDAPSYYLSALIRKHNPCARILFYMTWGRKNGDAANCAAWPPVCTYKGMDSLLQLRYVEMAGLNEAGLSPVGAVWHYIRENNPSIELYQTDESHPSLAGSYLAACCFYTSIFKKDPVPSTYTAGLNSTDAATIRQAVKKLVYDSLQKWDFGNYKPIAKFSYTIGNGTNEVVFNNQSENIDSCIWDFGDGNTSSATNPVHQYANDGLYTIKLNAINCDLGQTYISVSQKTVNFCAHNPTVYPDNLLLCPDVKDTLWTQPYDSYQWLDERGDTMPGETKRYILPKGGNNYSVLAEKSGCTEQSPQVYVSAYQHNGTYYVAVFGPFTGTDTLCTGDTLVLVLVPNKPPFPADSNIHWFRNELPLFPNGNDTIYTTQSGTYVAKLRDPVCPDSWVYQSQPAAYTFISCGPSGLAKIRAGQVQLYPNPATGDVQVTIPPALKGSPFFIYDILGKVILSGTLEEENNTVDVSHISNGIYLFRLQHEVIKFIRD